MTKSKWLILCLLLCMTAAASALETVATITAYNKAELSGDVAPSMTVDFSNTNRSKGQITADNMATMSIAGLPQGLITTVEVFVRSNSKSGKGGLAMYLDETKIAAVEECAFPDWPGSTGYSTTAIPIRFEGNWTTDYNSELLIRISASENSLTWEKTRIVYYRAEPEPFTVTLSWLAADGAVQHSEIKEAAVGAGVILPDCEVKTLTAGEEWTFVGWSKDEVIDKRSSEPDYYRGGAKFYPTANQTLYAVYSDAPKISDIVQTTQFKSGEYALVMACVEEYYIASGAVNKKRIDTKTCGVITNEEGVYKLTSHFVDVDYRYQIDFDGDSLSIMHVYSGESIGHSGIYLANNKSKWAWSENKNHSLELSYNSEEKDYGTVARVLWLAYADPSPYFEVTQLKLGSDYEYLLLFDVSDVPTSDPKTKWTSYPFGWNAVEQVTAPETGARKVLRNGVVLIERGNTLYNILGNKQK